MSINYNIGKSGDINSKEGIILYLYDKEKIGHIKLHNFDFLPILSSRTYKIITDEIKFNYENCLLIFDLKISENYRKKGYGTFLMKEVELFAKKNNFEFILGHRDLDNAEIFWSKQNVEIIGNDEKIEVFFKKI